MFELQASSQVGTALGHLAAAREQLSALDLAGLSGGQLLDLVAGLEIDTRQRAAVTHALIAEVDTRGVAAELGYTSTPVLLSERLRIGRREAAQRVRVAADLAPRRAMSGQPLPARFPKVAAAPVHLSTHRTTAAETATSSHGTVGDIAYTTASPPRL